MVPAACAAWMRQDLSCVEMLSCAMAFVAMAGILGLILLGVTLYLYFFSRESFRTICGTGSPFSFP